MVILEPQNDTSILLQVTSIGWRPSGRQCRRRMWAAAHETGAASKPFPANINPSRPTTLNPKPKSQQTLNRPLSGLRRAGGGCAPFPSVSHPPLSFPPLPYNPPR
eukprot:334492-Chlamydomonas_euryale.AAC.2